MTKILLATPAYGETFYTPYVSSVIRLQRLAMRSKWDLTFASIAYADIVESRNFLLTHFYDKTDATHLLFIDTDMGYDAQLVADMLKLAKPVVGVIAPRRQIDLNRLADLAGKGETAERAIARAYDFLARPARHTGKPRIVNGFMEVEGCGAGIMLIERSCIKTMLAKLPELSDAAAKTTSPLARNLDRLIRAFEPITVNGARLSEDYAFCHRWRTSCGGEVWANIAHKITHVGLNHFSARYQDAMPRGPRVLIGNAARSTAAGKPTAAANPTVTRKAITLKQPGAGTSAGNSKPVIKGTTRATVKEGALKGAVALRAAATPRRITSGLASTLPHKDKPNGG